MEKQFSTTIWGSYDFPFYPVMVDQYFQVFRFSILINALCVFILMVFLFQSLGFRFFGNSENRPRPVDLFFQSAAASVIYLLLFWFFETMMFSLGEIIFVDGFFLRWFEDSTELVRAGAISTANFIFSTVVVLVGKFIVYVASFYAIVLVIMNRLSKTKTDLRTSRFVSVLSTFPVIILLTSLNFVFYSKDYGREKRYIQLLVNWEYHFQEWKNEIEGKNTN